MVVVVVLLLITYVMASPGGHGEEANKLPVLDKPNLPATQSASTSGFLERRDVPEALIDPYSVLGVLSFGVYIFYILYHRYQMGMGGPKHNMPPGSRPGTPGGHMQPAGNTLFNMGSEEMAYLLDMASKILSNAAKLGGNTLNGTTPYALDTIDYYDDTTDLQTS